MLLKIRRKRMVRHNGNDLTASLTLNDVRAPLVPVVYSTSPYDNYETFARPIVLEDTVFRAVLDNSYFTDMGGDLTAWVRADQVIWYLGINSVLGIDAVEFAVAKTGAGPFTYHNEMSDAYVTFGCPDIGPTSVVVKIRKRDLSATLSATVGVIVTDNNGYCAGP